MSNHSSVFKSIQETSSNAVSNRKRIVVFIMAILLPLGTHNYYLGNYIKGLAQSLIIFGLFVGPIFITIFLIPFYIAWVWYEGVYYLLRHNVRDGDGFPMYDPKNPVLPNRNKAIKLAFYIPFGWHHIYLGNLVRGVLVWGFFSVLTAFVISIELIPFIAPAAIVVEEGAEGTGLPFYVLLYVALIMISWTSGMIMTLKERQNLA